ncbi:MAG: 3-deoxy-7-phosphoheptulonate synthase [Brevinematales bacterium]|nr:3-deoxy-7-phosphoheptulonate synthase [Brevinematales bacterium]
MIIVLSKEATESDIEHIIEKIKTQGLDAHISRGIEKIVIGVVGDDNKLINVPIESFRNVEQVIRVTKPYKLASRDFHPHNTVIDMGTVRIGGDELAIIAGPCSVETPEQIIYIAKEVKKYGANLLRGGAFKPRTSPYSFQGLGKEGLELLKMAKEATGLPIVTEVLDTRDVELVCEYADILQVGTRNAQNFALLKELGKIRKPVLLKRGLSMKADEWVMSAEYIMSGGNYNVILCERGIRTFETATRNTLDINIIPVMKERTHLPIIIDPSHATGKSKYVPDMALAAIAAGADGVMIEVHNDPENAWSDGDQSITPQQFAKIMEKLKPIAEIVGRKVTTVV